MAEYKKRVVIWRFIKHKVLRIKPRQEYSNEPIPFPIPICEGSSWYKMDDRICGL